MSRWGKRCLCLQSPEDDVSTLDYRHADLDDIPSDVFAHERTLEELYIDSNRIRNLPRELFYCVSLRTLSLSDNEIVSIPSMIESLINLDHLDISRNGQSNILTPAEILPTILELCSSTNLQYDLVGCTILQQLRYCLGSTYNTIVDLPASINACKHLKVVEASVNPLGKLPDGFTRLVNLTELYLNDAFLDALPNSFGRLSQLRILELRENRLKTLPSSMSLMTKIERLDIGTNDFEQLPEIIGNLVGLVELWCDNNKIKAITDIVGNLRELTFIDASKNCIDSLSLMIERCVQLNDLHLSYNLLKALPESIGRLSNLNMLKVDCNSIEILPFTLGGLVSLVELDVSSNCLQSLPIGLGLLRHLRVLYADDNFLVQLPSEIGSCCGLTILSLRCNNLIALPDELGHIPNLQMINVSDNKIKNLPFGMTKLKQLRALWLADNQSKPLIRLQCDNDPETGNRILTCYLLPQTLQQHYESDEESVASFHESMWEEERGKRRRIQFELNDDSHDHGHLMRTPTPYPKEMKLRMQHVRQLAVQRANGGTRSTDLKRQGKSVTGRRSERMSATNLSSLDGAGHMMSSAINRTSCPLVGERHRLLRADKDKQQKDKARMHHASDGQKNSVSTTGGLAGGVGGEVDNKASTTGGLPKHSSRDSVSPIKSIHRSPVRYGGGGGAITSQEVVTLLTSPSRSSIGNNSRMAPVNHNSNSLAAAAAATDINRNISRNSSSHLAGTAAMDINRNETLTSHTGVLDSSSVHDSKARNIMQDTRRARNERNRESASMDVTSLGAVNDSRVLKQDCNVTNQQSADVIDSKPPSKVWSGGDMKGDRCGDENDQNVIPPPPDDGIQVMSYSEFVNSLTAQGLPIPRVISRRATRHSERSAQRPSSQYSYEQSSRARGSHHSRRHHGYESDIVNESSTRHHHNHRRSNRRSGYDSEGYRSEASIAYRGVAATDVSYLSSNTASRYAAADTSQVSATRRAARQHRSSSDIYDGMLVDLSQSQTMLPDGSRLGVASIHKNNMLGKEHGQRGTQANRRSGSNISGTGVARSSGYVEDRGAERNVQGDVIEEEGESYRPIRAAQNYRPIKEENYAVEAEKYRGRLQEASIRQLRSSPERTRNKLNSSSALNASASIDSEFDPGYTPRTRTRPAGERGGGLVSVDEGGGGRSDGERRRGARKDAAQRNIVEIDV